MTKLGELAGEFQNGIALTTHLLLVGGSKTGKSRYVAKAAKAGFEVIYVDGDNGKNTLLEVLAGDVAAMNRIHYFAPKDQPKFIEEFLQMPTFRYNMTRNELFASRIAAPTDKIAEFYPSRIPRSVILSIDTWSSVTMAMIEQQAKKRSIDLSDVDKYGREIYGSTGMRATNLLSLLQHVPFHVIMQAHPGLWEQKIKPEGKNDVLEKDMTIKGTFTVPVSTSLPHGYNVPAKFNQIGWMGVNRSNQRTLDFKMKNGRVGAGSPNAEGDPEGAFSFVNLFGKPQPLDPEAKPWYVEFQASEYEAMQAAKHAAAPKLVTTPSKAATPAAPKPAVPGAMTLGSMTKK